MMFNLHLVYCCSSGANWRHQSFKWQFGQFTYQGFGILTSCCKKFIKRHISQLFAFSRCTVASCACKTCQNKTVLTSNIFTQKFYEQQTKWAIKKLKLFIKLVRSNLSEPSGESSKLLRALRVSVKGAVGACCLVMSKTPPFPFPWIVAEHGRQTFKW